MTQDREFGGPIGAFIFIIFSHFLVYYLWISFTYYQGSLIHPSSLSDILPFFGRMFHYIAEGAVPTGKAAMIYGGFLLLQFLLASTMPGLWVKGFPVPSEGNIQHNYLCNAIASWYVLIILLLVLHFTHLFRLTELTDNMGGIITVATIFADAMSLSLYLIPLAFSKNIHKTGNIIYDFFIGIRLNQKIGIVDIKLFIDIRISWVLLFLLTVSAAEKQYQLYGMVSWPMIFMLLAHGLYTNACMKGEECIPTTWDIFQEKLGWMFIYWNLVGVPFVYCFSSFYILANNPQVPYIGPLFIVLLVAYYVWDTANTQKNRFRMQLNGSYVPRYSFPQLPWGTLRNPRYLATKSGSVLLTDGWYRYARKIHYTADIIMALTWGLCCGFSGVLPYFYPIFFTIMILHRYHRDTKRCVKKYGEDWKNYIKTVPYRFIPFIF